MANSTIKFPQEMPPAATINGNDKIMISDAATNEAKSATWDAARQYLSITGIELKPVPAGPLPAGPAGEVRKMQITEAGTWTFAGSATSPFVNPNISIMDLWWDGSTWSIANQYPMPTIPVSDEVTEFGEEAVSQKGVFNGTIKPTDIGVKTGKNMFNYADVVNEKYINSSNGQVINAAGTTFVMSGIIPSGPILMTISGLSNIHYGLGWAFFKAGGEIVKFGGSSQDVTSFTVDGRGLDEDVFFHFTIITNKAGDVTSLSNIQVEKGSIATGYEPFGASVVKIKDLDISVDVVSTDPNRLLSPVNVAYLQETAISNSDITLVAGKNKFNPLNIESGYVDPTTGELLPATGYFRTKPIIIDKQGLFTVSGLGSIHHALGYRINKQDGSLAGRGSAAVGALNFTINTSLYPDSYSLQFTVKTTRTGDNTDINAVQVEHGGVPTEFEPYSPVIEKIKGYGLLSSSNDGGGLKTSGKKILFLGDSITTEDSNVTNWPTYARDMLGVTDYRNYARNGASFTNWTGHDNIRQQLSEQINAAISDGYSPDIIIIAVGTNDYQRLARLGDYDTAIMKPDLDSLDKTLVLEAARWAFWKCHEQWIQAVCFYAEPLQRAVTQNASEEDDNGLWLRSVIRRMANRYNFLVINQYSESGIVKDFELQGANGRYLSDGLHPNDNGKRIQARYISNDVLNRYY